MKISIIGAGNVGATTAHLIVVKNLGDVVLMDIVEGMPRGKALDICESTPIEGIDCNVTGTNDYKDTKDSNIAIVTAGLPRTPGMSRDDLLAKNTKIVKEVVENAAKHSPDAILIVVSNPLDAMVYVAKKVSGFPNNRVVGMAGILDSARFRTFIAREVGASVKDVHALVLGSHGDTMVPLKSNADVAGIPLSHFLSKDRIDALVERTRNGGAEIVNLLKKGSAYYSPAAAVTEMVDAIVNDRKRILPCTAYLDGEYGVKGMFLGVPVKLGKDGVEGIIELCLDKDEKAAFEKTVEHVRSLIEKTERFL